MQTSGLTAHVFDDQRQEKPDPFEVFSLWLEEAKKSELNDANAMSLATVDPNGMPDCRIMLLNGLDPQGFVFYTNTRSVKGRELEGNPMVCLLFHWKSSRRQVRIRGKAVRVSDARADAYFATRPRGSRVGAHASFQSRPMMERDELNVRVEQLTAKFEGQEVPRPDHWTGFSVEPVQIEFWQNGEFRLHDRVVYTRGDSSKNWATQRLNP
jgi:pyridoxamine 5'-phosphate oxidase